MPIGSILKTAIKELPDDFKTQSQSLPNILKKKGVKQEELDFAKLDVPKGKVTKGDLSKAEAQRADKLGSQTITEPNAAYTSYSLAGGARNPTYRENILTYSDNGASPGYVSEHFPQVPNYLMHTRSFDDTFEGTPTRVVQEIQSDLHQQARQGNSLAKQLHQAIKQGDEAEANDIAGLMGIPEAVDLNKWALENPSVVIPEAPYEKTWLRKGIEHEITEAVEQGRDQIAIPIKGDVDNLKRSEGVQKWYETVVESTARKLAKSAGMEYEIKTIDDVVYSTLKGKPKKDFNLYASPAAATMTAYLAFKGGMAQKDIEEQLTNDGYSELEVQDILADVQKVQQMKAAGYSDEDIKPLLEQQEVQVKGSTSKPTSPLQPRQEGRVTDAYLAITGNEEMTPQDLLSKMRVVYPDMSYAHTNVAGFFGDQEAARVSEEAVQAQRARIIAEAANRGLTIEWDEREQEWLAQTEQGPVVVTPEWYKAFRESKGEITSGIAGAIVGAKAGAAATPPPVTPPTAVLKAAAILGGSIVGAAAGAIGGSQLDYLHSAMVLQQDFEANVMANKAFNAAEMSVIADAATLGVLKLGGSSWKGLVKVKQSIQKGFFDRAHTALKETFFVTDDEAAELVAKLSNVVKIEGKTTKDQAVVATALTKPGGEELVKASVSADPQASRAIVKAIDTRAQDLLASTKNLSGDNVGRFIREDLEGYETLTKEQFTRVKAQAAQAPKLNTFSFNYDKMAIEPVLRELEQNIDPLSPVMFKFSRQAQAIRDISAGRRLPDLLELRKLVNNFKYNKTISSKKHFNMLNGLLTGIDRSIAQGAEVTMENPQAWLKSWKGANAEYAKMMDLKTNKLAKAIVERPAKDLTGKSEEDLAKAMTKYATALDSTFVDVITKLPKQSRRRVEGLVLDNLANKYTAGAVDGVKATNFPGLAQDLKSVNFTSPEARSMKKAIEELAEVFKNDLPLSQVAGGIQVPQFAQALTTSPVAKAKYALATETFHYVQLLKPTAKGRAAALIRKTAQLLENPMHSKTIKELQELADGQINIDQHLEDVIKATTVQKATNLDMTRVKLYGDGKVLVGKGQGKEHSIPVHRIAKTEDIKEISEATGINMADKKALDIALQERGYMAAQMGADKVRLLEK